LYFLCKNEYRIFKPVEITIRRVLRQKRGKIRLVETIPGRGKAGKKENDGGGEFNYDIFNIL
jgi:hypothetical protein